MKLSKKKVFALALAVCLLATLSMGSLAWFTHNDSVTNNFYVAGSEDQDPDDVFSVDVWENDEEGNRHDDGIEYPAILPGDELVKEVHIENTGAYDQYIRATVTVTGAAIWQEVYGMYIVPLDVLTDADLSGVHTPVAYYDVAQDAFVYELYYTDILEVGKDMIVFNTVMIDERLNRDQAAALQSFQITVVADAVQTDNVGANVYEAFKTVGLVNNVPVATLADIAAALAAEGEARIVLDPSVDWSANPIVVDYAVSNKTIDFNGQNGTIQFAAGSSAENVTITGLIDTDGVGYSVETVPGFTGDLLIANCDFIDQSGGKFGAVRPAAGDVTIDNCTFTGIGKSYGVRTDNRTGDLTIKNSTFTTLGSWAILVNGANDGNLTVDNCTFDTRDGVLKTLGEGVKGDFTFTNNTLIDCKGHDGNINKLIVSGSGTDPVKATGTITYANNTYITTVEGEQADSNLKDALQADKENIVVDLTGDVTYDVRSIGLDYAMGGASTKTITINGNGYTITFNGLARENNYITTNNNAKLIINDANITATNTYSNTVWNVYDAIFACDVELNNVTSDKPLALKADAVLNNVTVNNANDVYAIWIQPNGQTVTIDGLTVNAGRGIKIDEQYLKVAPEKVTLSVSNATFNTAEKAAIVVKSAAGAEITLENVDIANTADTTNAVWVDADAAASYDKVTVTGGSKVQEQ